jgi:hypothetical protein
MGQFDYDLKDLSKSSRTVLSWKRLKSLDIPLREGCKWITDASIQHCLKHNLLEDAREPQSALSHHDARIAFLVKKLQAGKKLDAIHIHISKKKISIFDGAHRLRAHQFLGLDNVEAIVTASKAKRLQRFRELYNVVD